LAARGQVVLRDLFDPVLMLYPQSPQPGFANQVLKQFSVRGDAVGKAYETNGLQTAIGPVAPVGGHHRVTFGMSSAPRRHHLSPVG